MWLDHLRIALTVLRAHKVRSFLTVISITIGAFSIVLMTSLADSGLKTLLVGVEELGGTRMISLWRKPPEAMEARQLSYSRGLTRQDTQALQHIPHLLRMTELAMFRGKGMQSDKGQQVSGDIVAADASFLEFFNYRVGQGRLLDEHDQIAHARVCIVGDELADRLFGKGESVMGRAVSVLGARFKVVGRLARLDRWGIRLGWQWDDVLVVPLETVSDSASREVDSGRQIFMLTEHPRHNEMVKRVMNARLMERHHGIDDFSIFDLEKRLQGFFKVFLIMKVIVGLIASITLLVGGVGIMNIMLVSVSERVREIGIRKALGAGPSDIGRQFLVEAVLLSSSGGLAGTALGIGLSLLASRLILHFKPSWVTSVSRPAVIAALLVTLIVGVIFGYFPARRAGRLNPVTAMRS